MANPENNFAVRALNAYRRSKTKKPPPNNGAQDCDKCNNWGGVHGHRIAHTDRGGGTAYLRWQRIKCDRCTWPKGEKRSWPVVTEAEELQNEEIQECEICGEERMASGFPVLITLRCAHEQLACLACVRSWVTTQLDAGECSVGCPVGDCPAVLDPADIQRHCPSDLNQRQAHPETQLKNKLTQFGSFLDLSLKQSLANDQTFRYCANTACKSGQFVRTDSEQFQCDACQSTFCLAHQPMGQHPDETCAVYDARMTELKRKRDVEDQASEQEVKRIAMPCPGCDMQIQKIAGCDHMTCRHCKFEFCYACGANYQRIRQYGNEEHKPNCRYHSSNLHPEYHYVRT